MDARRLVTGAAEIRAAADGPHLHGTLLQEGRAASGGRRELFVPGSVQWPSQGVGILTAHRQAPEIRTVPVRESDGRITVRTPATSGIRAAVEGGRRFMSVEFHALEERTTKGGVREVLRAFVPRAALVADPEYDSTSAEVRARRTLRATVPAGVAMDCRCSATKTGAVDADKVSFHEDAFDEFLKRPDAVAVMSRLDRAIADTRSGSLRFEKRRAGLEIEVNPIMSTAGNDLVAQVEAGMAVHARPLWDPEVSEWVMEGTVAKVTKAAFSVVLVRAVQAERAQNVPVVELAGPPPQRRSSRKRRLKVWL